MRRTGSNTLVLCLSIVLCACAALAIALLQHRHGDHRDDELRAERIRATLNQLQSAPYGALAPDEAAPRVVRQENRFARDEMIGFKEAIAEDLRALEDGWEPDALAPVPATLEKDYAALDDIYRLGSTTGFGPEVDRIGQRAGRLAGRLDRALRSAADAYHSRATASRDQAIAGSTAAIALLLGSFGFFLFRSGRLQREKDALLAVSREEALTDALTGLSNRRALMLDLAEVCAERSPREHILAVFDLDGFKQYNDAFGHPAGDALLARLGRRVGDLARPGISAYRMGGDEFCMLAALEADGAEIVAQASEALSEHGEAFSVGCSYGTVVIPTEASTPSDALRVSDGRMYRVKAVRGATTRESIDVLLKVLEESNGELVGHLRHVAEFAAETARDLGLDELEVSRVQAAAELHDIGKSAIPRSILDKPGELDAAEWRFMRQHTLIGERIAQAAPSLANVAELIRSTHERFDGKGYPDGLAGESIPLGARIIAVCDAYDAMTSERPYSPRLASGEALKELRRCAGDQFDPKVVKAFARVAERLGGAGNGAPPRPRSEAGGDAGEGDGQVEEVVGVVDRDEAEDV